MRERACGKCATEQLLNLGNLSMTLIDYQRKGREEGVIITENQAGDVIKVKI